MYLARVLVGEYTVGRTGLLTPPPKDQDPTDTFDSVVDQIPDPGIFVAFYDWQCYPEYLITFKWTKQTRIKKKKCGLWWEHLKTAYDTE